ncbi:Major facilitator superfamily domain-containing, protein [Aphelenchoides bicaudatus]|nr:Major facilitator superfamily domain-containing, protein [Aphelenchoides bicaudatus]
MYTAPAITCCVINILCILGLQFVFEETYAGLANSNNSNEKIRVPKYDKKAVGLCHLTRFVQLFAFTNLETIGTPFVMAMFALNSAQTVQALSVCHSISGLLGFIIYMVHATRKKEIVDFRKLLIFGFLGFLLFHISTFPVSFLQFEAYKLSNNTGIEPVGCPVDSFAWCNTTGQVNFWVFMVMMCLVLGVFWPNVNVSLSTLLSKILGPRRQANQQSLFQMSASFARLTGPLLISNIYTFAGPMYTWSFEISVLVFIIIVWIFAFKRMVPLKMPEVNEIPPELEESSSDLEIEEDKDAHNFARF